MQMMGGSFYETRAVAQTKASSADVPPVPAPWHPSPSSISRPAVTLAAVGLRRLSQPPPCDPDQRHKRAEDKRVASIQHNGHNVLVLVHHHGITRYGDDQNRWWSNPNHRELYG